MIGLFLDLSTKVGWSHWDGPTDPSPRFGTFRLKQGGEIGPRTLALRRWLRDRAYWSRFPDVLGFESPLVIPPRANAQASIIRLQIALATEIETTALDLGIPHVFEVATMSAKKALTGSGTLGPLWKGRPAADRSKEWKLRMICAAHGRGWDVKDDHQADAGAVGLVVWEELGYREPKPGPLL